MSPFIYPCQCVRGFFTLRACDAKAAGQCARCQRHVCAEHLNTAPAAAAVAPSPARPGPICVECAARAQEDRVLDDDDDAWFFQNRRRYYANNAYRPIYWGPAYHYDHYDVRSFDRRAAADPDDPALAAPGGLEDS